MRERQITLAMEEIWVIEEKIEKLTKKRDRVKARLEALRARCQHHWMNFASDATMEGSEKCGLERKKELPPKPTDAVKEVAEIVAKEPGQ